MSCASTFLDTVRPYLAQKQLTTVGLQVIQLNLGLRCNLSCQHCHLGASPRRSESMSWAVMERVLRLVDKSGCREVDLTGGAPEYHPLLRTLIENLHHRQVAVQLRSNLAILMEEDPQMATLPAFLRAHQVTIIASLPCYLPENVDAQRGSGVYQQTIAALHKLNQLGYGREDHLPLHLVYNPGKAFLPPNQQRLEEEYRQRLWQMHAIHFHRLYTMTNMPIGRFQAELRRSGEEERYGQLLRNSFNPATLEPLMCRKQISIRWDGALFDCDFNLALGWPANVPAQELQPDYDPQQLAHRSIVTGNHCFACTAGCGSSCGGALAA
ncbi:arsenosugar biosynthesis radical SAM (seleno)protein ArsS [Candidatus Magnetaquicoccus inordinatus]|uniref:arsenosugar biosynthesis radical SAM (seleno)protein ArsS n=1 Tax=Candidatus Magnetaquicoccus inordinatus TaxID=2496818 RepID=UPI00102C7A6E|nr:arsenosugar biosynthesis radical SAM (seleno)protein ArsS [Candidatus Magnetaquicoccus inordinatus]